MIEIITDRLLIIPCSLDIAKSLIFHRKELETRSPIGIPCAWPSSAVRGMLPLYIEKLEENDQEYGWGLWLIILYNEKELSAICFFRECLMTAGQLSCATTFMKLLMKKV